MFGAFNLTIDNFGGYQYAATQVQFEVTNKSGTWANVSDVLALNGPGQHHGAAHIFATADPVSPTAPVIATGFVATPEFGSGMLMAGILGGFLGLTGLRYFRRQRLVAVA